MKNITILDEGRKVKIRVCFMNKLGIPCQNYNHCNILEVLDKKIPSINNDDTLLYGPEIKFFSNEINTDNSFKLKDENLHFIGDGAGKLRNIVTAAATGLVVARDILKSEDNYEHN